MKSWKMPLMAAAVLGLTGCAVDHGPYAGHDVKWFEAHQKSMSAQIDWCRAYYLKNGKAATKRIHACKEAATAYHDLQVKANRRFLFGSSKDNGTVISSGNVPIPPMQLPTMKP